MPTKKEVKPKKTVMKLTSKTPIEKEVKATEPLPVKNATKALDFRDESLVYYGPHPCQKCDPDGSKGTNIVKAGNGAPDDLEFNVSSDSYYPNHVYRKHECVE